MTRVTPGVTPTYCNGHVIGTEEADALEKRISGDFGERVCIRLVKPKNVPIKITKHDVFIPSVGVKIISQAESFPEMRSVMTANNNTIVAGTTKQKKIRVYTQLYRGLRPRPKAYSGVAFRDRLKIIVNKLEDQSLLVTSRNSYHCTDMVDVFASGRTSSTRSDEDSEPQPIKVNCVVQQKKTLGIFRFAKKNDVDNSEQIVKGRKFNGLHRPGPEPEDETSRLIRHRIPTELYFDIWRFMNYDQVSFLADRDERFARSLASSRYKIDSYDKNRYPDLPAVLTAIRKENVKEIRFYPNEDMWVASLNEYSKDHGVAIRYPATPGVYRWQAATPITAVRFDSHRAKCAYCLKKLTDLQKAMLESQDLIVRGCSSVKILSLEGSEGTNIDDKYASLFYQRPAATSVNFDFNVHLWMENLEHRWLHDVQIENDRLTLDEYRNFKHCRTLIFKDPVKFFGTLKVLDVVDDGIFALTSKLDNEVIGYLVQNSEWRLRVPRGGGAPAAVIGLNVLPIKLVTQAYAARELVKHVRCHEVQNELDLCDLRISEIEKEAANARGNDQVLRNLREEMINLFDCKSRLGRIKQKNYELDLRSVLTETLDDRTVHIHEMYHSDFDFCTVYSFNELGECATQDTKERNATLLFSRCSHEERHPEHFCSLKVVNPLAFCSAYAIETGKTLNIV